MQRYKVTTLSKLLHVLTSLCAVVSPRCPVVERHLEDVDSCGGGLVWIHGPLRIVAAATRFQRVRRTEVLRVLAPVVRGVHQIKAELNPYNLLSGLVDVIDVDFVRFKAGQVWTRT